MAASTSLARSVEGCRRSTSTPRKSWPNSWSTSRATASTRSGTGSGTRRQALDEITTIPKALRASPGRAVPAESRGRQRRAERPGRDAEVGLSTARRRHDRDGPHGLRGPGDGVRVQSQAGCAMGCTFCATGQAGFTRHLTSGEVLEQVMFAARAAAPRRLSNVVFMGMGEPLANYLVTMDVVRSTARVPRTVGASPHRVDRRRRAGDRDDGQDRPAAHAGREPARGEQRDREANSCRSIAATRSSDCTRRASSGWTRPVAGSVSSGRSSTA